MDPNTLNVIKGAAGAGGEGLYVEEVFSTDLYKGNEGVHEINNGIDLSGEGGMVWIKRRKTGAERHALFDTVRGKEYVLASDEDGNTRTRNFVQSIDTDGFTLNTGDTEMNNLDDDYVSWTFRKAPGFFDVVTWNGSGTNDTNNRISHSLGCVPGMIIVKKHSDSQDWYIYHRSTGVDSYGALNNTTEFTSGFNCWGTSPTTSDFGINEDNLSASSGSYVAYIFAHDDQSFGEGGNESIIKCGTYTGAVTAPTVDLGFEPQFVFLKCATRTGNYGGGGYLFNSMQGIHTGANDLTVQSQESNEEAGGGNADMALTPTGFKLEGSGVHSNDDGGTYLYMAIRRGPMKTPEDATKVFNLKLRAGTGADSTTTGIGFAPDAAIIASRDDANGSNRKHWFDRIRGNENYLVSNENWDESGANGGVGYSFDNEIGTAVLDHNNVVNRSSPSVKNYVDYFLKRAPEFFDIVCYDGDSDALSEKPHNLGVKPEMILIKNRTYSSAGEGISWTAWHKHIFDTTMVLNSDDAWINSGPTSTYGGSGSGTATGAKLLSSNSTHFLTSNAFAENSIGETYVAYLFATCPGVSEVGSYTGTGNDIDVDCGFTAGARFVMIKRTDSTGDWYVWDAERGIVAGNDPYLLMNNDAVENSNDYIDPHPQNKGFTVISTAPALNDSASGSNYIYLAIA